MIYITGDTHGDMNRIVRFCERMETSQEDIMIILGDVGLNYYGDSRDRRNKEKVANLPITLFCIHGNHERRPTTIVEYKLQEWNGGKVWVEEAYPNILFAKDGEIYDIAGMKTIVIGGAYSVDKFYRLSKGYNWFEDEQPSDEIKAYVEKQLSNNDWNVDVVLSHTVPYDYRPVDLFLSMIDQSTVDESTELWLGEIEKKLDYKWWYAGHYHTSNLAEGFMLISEQEKSGKVERRKDMQTMTSAYANKMLKSLEEDKAFWLNKEEEACTYVAAINEEPVVPDYDYVEVATTIAALDEKIAIIKHELNVTNANAKVLVGDVTMSIDSILIKMAQLNRRKTVLDVMRKRLPKSREEQRSYMSRNSVPEYRYINYDLELVKNEYELVSKSIMEMQMALDKYNQTVQFEVDI